MKFKKKGFDYSLLETTFTPPQDIAFTDWNNVFGNKNPLIVEIGCGNGHFLTQQALKNRSENFIGIDLKDYRIVKSRMKENLLQLTNIRWICGEAGASIERMFPDKSLKKIYMTFPDPWPKKRHWKHRLFQADFIPLVARKLTDNGKFIFISDHEGYYQWCMDLIEAQKELVVVSHEYDISMTESAFGKIWTTEQRAFHSFTLEKYMKY
ncbi:MAG: tRNA (guanosine(46)-N7)-methyltransferase TrmB [Spirochaetales bacterium]|nr:tRNA (guanosine(46)-N7)-methyltransferase TrmB [Spirochaetales bacterium]